MTSLLLCCAVLLAQDQPSEVPPTSGTVSGQILNAATRQPLVGVEVYLFQSQGPDENNIVRTGEDGRFRIENLRPGIYSLGARKPGFLARRPGLLSNLGETKRLDLKPNTHIEDLKISLRPAAALSGKVIGENGETLPRLAVIAVSLTKADPKNGWGHSSRARTGTNGEYRFPSLEPGAYWIVVFPALPKAGTGYPRTLYPNSETLQGAEPVYVSGGEEKTQINFRLGKVPFYTISGTYAPVPRALQEIPIPVELRGENVLAQLSYDEVFHTQLNGDGSFQFAAIRPGTYRVDVLDPARPKDYASAEVEVSSQSISDLRISPRPLATLTGRMRFESQKSLPHSIDLILEPVEAWLERTKHTVRSSPDGSFLLHGVRPGRYLVDLADSSSREFLQSIRIGNFDPSNVPVHLSETSPPMLLRLSPAMANLSGQVHSIPSANGGVVLFRPVRAFHSRLHSLISKAIDSAGKFPPEPLAPGEYWVYSFASLDFAQGRDEWLLQRLQHKAVFVRLAPNEHKSIQLPLISSVELEAAEAKASSQR